MLRTRVIPCLLLKEACLVKTVRYKKYSYIGDPINTVRIFNELEVDELMFLDIGATKNNTSINFEVLQEIANECFMPLSYGGGIKSFEDVKRIFEIGVEKIVINSYAFKDLSLIKQISTHYGNQSVIGSIDVKESLFGKKYVYSHQGRKKQKIAPIEWAKQLEIAGVGELLITSIDHEGLWNGYDVNLIQEISDAVRVPVIAHGGAGKLEHIRAAVFEGNASAVALGSMVVYQKKDMGVLVNFPDVTRLRDFVL